MWRHVVERNCTDVSVEPVAYLKHGDGCIRRNFHLCHITRWDSSVGVLTCYGLDGLGIESQWKQDVPHPSGIVAGPNSYRVSFPW